MSATVDRPQLGESGRRRAPTPPPPRPAPAGLTEAEFQQQVIDYARLSGWLVHHVRAARTLHGWNTAVQGDIGFPDIVLTRGRRLVFVELKSSTGRLSKHQQRWLVALRSTGADVRVWRPGDWDEVESTLRRAT